MHTLQRKRKKIVFTSLSLLLLQVYSYDVSSSCIDTGDCLFIVANHGAWADWNRTKLTEAFAADLASVADYVCMA